MRACFTPPTRRTRRGRNTIGDIQEKITTISSKLLFFPLELNRLDDQVLEAAMADPELGHYRPWLEDLRKERPYQLEDKLEQLFHEKAVTGRGAWNRLFNETMTSLRFEVEGEKLSLEPTLNRLLDQDDAKRRHAAEALARVFKDNVRLFTLITNTLAKDKEISDRWRGFADVAEFPPSRQPRRERGRRCAGERGA